LAKKLAAEIPNNDDDLGPISSKDPYIGIPSNIESIQENVTELLKKYV
jgi:hypothetical protein